MALQGDGRDRPVLSREVANAAEPERAACLRFVKEALGSYELGVYPVELQGELMLQHELGNVAGCVTALLRLLMHGGEQIDAIHVARKVCAEVASRAHLTTDERERIGAALQRHGPLDAVKVLGAIIGWPGDPPRFSIEPAPLRPLTATDVLSLRDRMVGAGLTAPRVIGIDPPVTFHEQAQAPDGPARRPFDRLHERPRIVVTPIGNGFMIELDADDVDPGECVRVATTLAQLQLEVRDLVEISGKDPRPELADAVADGIRGESRSYAHAGRGGTIATEERTELPRPRLRHPFTGPGPACTNCGQLAGAGVHAPAATEDATDASGAQPASDLDL